MKLCNYALLSVSLLGAALSFAAAPTPAPDCATSLATLTVGTQFGLPPYESLNAAGIPVGFDVDIACELRKRLGYNTIVFKAIDATDTASLSTGAVSVIISGLNEINPTTLTAPFSTNEALIKYSDFNFAFLFNGAALPILGGAPVNTGNVFNYILAQSNLTPSIPTGTITNSWENTLLLAVGINSTTFDTVDLAVAALKAGTISAFFSNNVVVDTVAAADATVSKLDSVPLPANAGFNPFRSTGLAIGVSPTCCQLYVNIRQAIADMVTDGTYAKIATANKVPTTFTAGPDLTPAACAATEPNLPVRNDIANFIFNKFCVCKPTVATS